MSISRPALAVVFLLIGIIGGGILLWFGLSESEEPAYATRLPQPRVLANASLVDQDGNAFSTEYLAGDWSLVFFGFTHCPDICPATLQQLAIARDQSEKDGRTFPRIVLISVDPERDTPERLKAYVANFGANVHGITGEISEIRKLTDSVGVFFTYSGEGAGYSVDHSTAVLLIDPDGRWHSVFTAPHTVDQFVSDIPVLTDPK